MKKIMILAPGLLLTLPIGCHKDKNDKDDPVVIQTETPIPGPDLVGGFSVGSIKWNLPGFLDGQFKNLTQGENAEEALDLPLKNGTEGKNVRVNSGFSVKTCDPLTESLNFVNNVPWEAADNLPDALKTDTDEIKNWAVDSATFKGRLYLKKRYKSEGEIGIYRFDALIANEKTSECVFWNLVFSPTQGVSTEFIEQSFEYKELNSSLVETWKGIGASFEE